MLVPKLNFSAHSDQYDKETGLVYEESHIFSDRRNFRGW